MAGPAELAARWEQILPPEVDLKTAWGDTDFLAQMGTIVDPRARFRFMDVEGGTLGDEVVEKPGVEGLQAGWERWLEPWDEFRIRWEGHEAVGEDRVLSLVVLEGRIRGGLELSQEAASVARVEGERIVAMDFYMDRDQARRDAGVE